jgi:RND superfamily putative drug exporter
MRIPWRCVHCPEKESAMRMKFSLRGPSGQAYGRLIYRFRWFILVGWTMLLLAGAPMASAVSSVLTNSGYKINSSQSSQVDSFLSSVLHAPTTQILAVFHSDTLLLSDSAYQRALQAFETRASRLVHVSSVTVEGIGQDGRTTVIALSFNQGADAVASRLADVRALLPHTGPVQAFLTGDAAISDEIQRDSQQDLETAELVALPLTLLVLLLVFGSVIASCIPLILATVAVSSTLASISLLTRLQPVNIFAQSMTTILGLGLSIDYSLLVLRRFREELAGNSVGDAIARTMATAGSAILLSGLIVATGFTGLMLIDIGVMFSFGVAGIMVSLIAVLAALTLLPALLSVLGQRVNAWRVPGAASLVRLLTGRSLRRTQEALSASVWQRWAFLVMRRPLVSAVLASLFLLGLSWPMLALSPGLPGAEALPASSEARRGMALVQAQFPLFKSDPVFVVARTADTSPMLAARNLAHLARLATWIAGQPGVVSVTGLTNPPAGAVAEGGRLSTAQLLQAESSGEYQRMPALRALVATTTAGDTTLLTLRVSTPAGSPADQALIDRLRAPAPQATIRLVTLVGGTRVTTLDFDRALYQNFWRALLFILLTTYILLFSAFRSALLPLKAIMMNVLSVGAAYGVLVFVFQQGHGAQALSFTPDGFLDRFIPLLLFSVAFGLSTDYEVFLLSRVREEWQRTGENMSAVARGLEKTGSMITSAALFFVIVSGSFVFTSLIVTKELGLGISVAVLVDATVVRCLLVPATMRLLGRWNWWSPRFTRRA